MFVLTIDQENSRVVGDRVPELLELFGAHLRGRWAPVVEFSRSVGDEVQGVIESPWALWAAVRLALRSGGWYVGIGLGVVDEPLPVRSSEGLVKLLLRLGTLWTMQRRSGEQFRFRCAVCRAREPNQPVTQ